jgi:hypothetical protein
MARALKAQSGDVKNRFAADCAATKDLDRDPMGS